MLWMRAWLETRWRVAYVLAYPLIILAIGRLLALSPAAINTIFFAVFGLCVLASMNFGGAGIHTRSIFHTMRGQHESMTFTLTLPVSRVRLLIVRAAFGLLETVGFIAVVICAEWALYPAMRANLTLPNTLKSILEGLAFCIAVYFLSVFFATFLEDLPKIYATATALVFLMLVAMLLHLPRSVDIFRVMTDNPAAAHPIHWGRIAVSCGVALISFLAAMWFVQTHEY
jgi:hypothetical protein